MFSLSLWKPRSILLSCLAVVPHVTGTASYAKSSPMDSATNSSTRSFSISYVTAPSEEVAEKIANGLVNKHLAACVNIIPAITSIYRWEGKVEKDKEVLMMVKSPTSSLKALTAFVKNHHPYEVCEVISIPIQEGNPEYLQFLHDATLGGKH